ncbi:hypothetical protein R3X27_05965 [Tropicimonas sp. TH_r6]|uniref:hypothetical protein n=1 Tax=Tropicimonas sp. TH_r6 TaxID=3082085 RepID=UPI002953D3D0|nr:hypothetical protein [Tropicimonas sp. TH_r6]MDV7142221.1 hypothetical protein [Tropicimonas sp. TH_r6]
MSVQNPTVKKPAIKRIGFMQPPVDLFRQDSFDRAVGGGGVPPSIARAAMAPLRGAEWHACCMQSHTAKGVDRDAQPPRAKRAATPARNGAHL